MPRFSTKNVLIGALIVCALIGFAIVFTPCVIICTSLLRANSVRHLQEEFAVGKSSVNFIKRARELGAYELWFTPEQTEKERQAEMENISERNKDASQSANDDAFTQPVLKGKPNGRHASSNYGLGDRGEFDRWADALEQNFDGTPSGTAEMEVIVVPPYDYATCEIRFKDRTVTSIKMKGGEL